MCRLAAYVGPALSPATLVFSGEHSLYRQSWAPREMLSGTVNADGLGVAWYSEGAPVRLLSDRPAWHTPEHRPLLASVRSGVIAASVRNATEGLGIDLHSVAPLAHDRWTFTLNGYVEAFRPAFMRSFREELGDDLYGELSGSSDTETLFLMLVHRMRQGASPDDALRALAAEVSERVQRAGHSAQLNMLLTDGEAVRITRTGTLEKSNSLYVTENWKGAPGGCVAASEPLDPGEWTPVEDHSLVMLRPDGVSVEAL